jgi:hypothetical protein
VVDDVLSNWPPTATGGHPLLGGQVVVVERTG